MPQRHRFAYLFERFPSFVQTFVYREAEEMVRQGMNPLLASVREPEDPADLREQLQAEVFYLPEEKTLRAEIERDRKTFSSHQRAELSKWRALPDSGRVFEALWLGRRLKEQGIHHVHAHFGALAARTAWHIQRLWGISYSFTGHANDIFCDNDFPVSNTMLAEGAKFIVTETDYARSWMEEKYPSIRGHVFRVFNGIRMEGFPEHAEPAGPARIVSVGRYVEKKGFPDLIAACALIRDRGHAFQCDIVGGGPMEAELAALIQQHGLQDHVRLLGPRPQAEVRPMLAAARVSVLACRYEKDGGSDNLPTVIMEAMACGTPVVSTPVAGVPEMVDEGETGRLVAEGDVPALADALIFFLREPDEAQRMGTLARTLAKEKFAVENTTAQLARLLDQHALSRPWWKRLFS